MSDQAVLLGNPSLAWAAAPGRAKATTPARPAWHLLLESGRAGPFSEEAVQQKLAVGEIHRSTLAWRTGLPDWQELFRTVEFRALASEVAGEAWLRPGPRKSILPLLARSAVMLLALGSLGLVVMMANALVRRPSFERSHRAGPDAERVGAAEDVQPAIALKEGGDSLPEGVSPEQVSSAMNAHEHAVVICSEEQAERDPDLHGELRLQWSILPSGGVRGPKAVTFADSYVAACLMKQLSGWKFPRSRRGALASRIVHF